MDLQAASPSSVRFIDPDAEKAALASALLNLQALELALKELSPDDFVNQNNRHIFQAILEIVHSTKSLDSVDRVTIISRLKASGTYEAAGGLDYLVHLTDTLPIAEDMRAYIRLIKNMTMRRRLIDGVQACHKYILDPQIETPELVRRVENVIYSISEKYRTSETDNNSLDIILDKLYTAIQERRQNDRHLIGISTTFLDLDEMTGGMPKGEFIILAARPSMGKTALALNMVLNLALQDVTSIFFSLEMTNITIAARLMAMHGDLNLHSLMKGLVSDEEMQSKVATQSSILSGLSNRLIIDDTQSFDPTALAIMAQRYKRLLPKLDLICVDYLTLIQPFTANQRDPQAIRIAAISGALKRLARDLNIPILCLAQLNRQPSSADRRSAGFRPMLTDLRDSGAIEQDADQVWLLHRPEYYEPDNPNVKGVAEVIVAKNRNGPTGTAHLLWDGPRNKFRNMDKSKHMT